MIDRKIIYRLDPRYVELSDKQSHIEGLVELQRATIAWDRYRNDWYAFEEGYSEYIPRRPKVDVSALRNKYPRAAAYMKASKWMESPNYNKSEIGMRAMERILAGEDHMDVIQSMMNEWDACCKAAMEAQLRSCAAG